MDIIDDIGQMQKTAEAARCAGQKIGFVPTMGCLHEGHLSLVRRARQLSQLVVVSLFVNPTQFGPGEDYESYPRDLSRDIRLVQEAGGDILFVPADEQMYPRGHSTSIHVEGLSGVLCGASRPDHFRGVATVVAMLFHIVKPHLAVFGQKDAQQAIVIRRMVADLHLDVDIEVAPTVREPDGLAMSSRNQYLTARQREEAAILYSTLQWARSRIDAGERRVHILVDGIRCMIAEGSSAEIDYISVVDTSQLRPVEMIRGEVLIALAAKFGRARLIDNIMIQV